MTQYNKMFEYSNKSDQSRSFMQDFWVEAFQNGGKLNEPGGDSSEGIPKSVQDAYNPIGKGSSAVIGQAFVLQDYSPIHIEVKNNGGSAPSQSMRLETEPYEDTSFDINRLYGSWEDENSDKILTLTSSFLEFGDSKSKSSTQYLVFPKRMLSFVVPRLSFSAMVNRLIPDQTKPTQFTCTESKRRMMPTIWPS